MPPPGSVGVPSLWHRYLGGRALKSLGTLVLALACFRVSMLLSLQSPAALCSLRLGTAGPGALDPGQRAATFLLLRLLLRGKKGRGSHVSPERTPHTRRGLTAHRQISLPRYILH